ncbi:uncharacterized protein F4822DRAFT_332296 [Hypoxylon trugodes]|uniref:uncharacterized protein n=1 Tax=Hypoxylon trugodes TaxID=326681 RepID=UPI00219B8B2E|nr:uncharacterized protein F4822DRAFT_332296 [Hypoxylon trugodes]KAI1387010.1 hypothetical protein F4822DRAFT_332296 [Hypoxylon trugodes]
MPSLRNIVIALAGLSAVSARSLYNLHRPYGIPPKQIPSRSTGTGPTGFLTIDKHASTGDHEVHAAFAAADGSIYSSCLEDTTATVSDCQAVIGDIRANNGSIKVASGFCLNWWEGACMGRVCAGKGQDVWAGNSSWIADTMTTSILDSCVSNGKAGAAGDCADVESTCGTYRLELLTYTGA